MSNVERGGAGFSFVKRRGFALRVLVSEGFGFRIISGRVLGLWKETIYI